MKGKCYYCIDFSSLGCTLRVQCAPIRGVENGMITMLLTDENTLDEEINCLLEHQYVCVRLRDPSNEGINFVQFIADVEEVIETESQLVCSDVVENWNREVRFVGFEEASHHLGELWMEFLRYWVFLDEVANDLPCSADVSGVEANIGLMELHL